MRVVSVEEALVPADLQEVFDRLQARRWALAKTGPKERLARLEKLKALLLERREELADALHEDFHKPAAEVEATEILPVLLELAHVQKHLKAWMKPRRVGAPLLLAGTKSEVHPEPRGVVLILAPWNYPFHLLVSPLVAAVAAGNAVLCKPSEKTPGTARFLAQLLRDVFPADEVALVEGGPEVGEALLRLPFDHFFFTGGPRVGRRVMEAAARHLAGVTLELGGKSPVIVDASADVATAAERIVWGKFLNAGQTCIAPDHVWVHASKEEALLAGLKDALERFYGKSEEARRATPDFCRMVDDGAFRRVSGLMDRTVAQGARVVAGGGVHAETRYIAPTVLADVTPEAPVMGEEIFGPLLPVLRFESLDEVVTQVRAGGKPLALYVFSQDEATVERLLTETSAGGTVVNNVVLHNVNPHLPFGGVGQSGVGAYHGEAGFKAFSHERAVVRQGRTAFTNLFFPPYRGKAQRLARLASKLFE
ncbi:aldehyde dehydrogenase family protein [Corallococcus sp. ZKHCc1 1396]|uniref:Aldehyde dehydrogenase n=1 Tax=Corallococcus soli TaxID=2710757 RepID=A0ABR9PGH7_9BACT|nr:MULTISPECIES: aldehyde dehydrogenase family protein [Corallococcus]MBE4746964.1 aldehyde dehydrogenase family protein [Corallococcus soli]MCY1030510.1 aldehyde dehydrogenase family protein [Corallococcus sp. BB11-1]